MLRRALILAISTASAAVACEGRECRALKAQLLARYDAYADRCASGADCRLGRCDTPGTGVCGCESDAQCESGLCLTARCANPTHDRRLTPGLADRGLPVRPVCQAFLRAARDANVDPACNAVFALLEAEDCHVCDEAAYRLCACRTGAALHECLVALAFGREAAGGPPDDEDSVLLCEDQVVNTACVAHKAPPGAACGGFEAGVAECRSGICRDHDPVNNDSASGDDPRDWVCADPCAADDDCLSGWRCDTAEALRGAPAARPFTCRLAP